jgi:hypothetical protein
LQVSPAGQERIMSTFATPKRTALDHAYTSCTKQEKRKRLIYENNSSTKQDAPTQSETVDIENCQMSDADDISDGESLSLEEAEHDVSYVPTESEIESESEAESITALSETDTFIQERKFIIYQQKLEELMRFCKECGAPVISRKQYGEKGSAISYSIECHSGCQYVWQSQPYLDMQPAGNIAISSGILITGNTFTKVKDFAKSINLQFISETTYLKHQSDTLIPVVQQAWHEERAKIVQQVQGSDPLILAEIGRAHV